VRRSACRVRFPRRGSRGAGDAGGHLQNLQGGPQVPQYALHLRPQHRGLPLHARLLRRRRHYHRHQRPDPLFPLQEHALQRGERQPDLLRSVGRDDLFPVRAHELRHVQGHPLLLHYDRQYRRSPGHLAVRGRRVQGRSLFSDRLLPLGAADSLRPGHPRQGAAGHGASRGAGLCGPQSVRRMRDVHRRDLRPRGRFAARVSDASRCRPGARHLGGGQGDEGPAAALCRQSALQRQHGVLRAFPQQRRHAADEPDLQSRKVEVGARRLPGSDHAGRGQRAQALRKPERDCGCNRCRARRDQLPRLLRRTALEHDRVPLGNGRPDRHRALAALRRRAPEAAVQYRRLLHQHRSDVRVRGDVLHAQRPAVGPRPRDHAYRPLCL